MDDNDASASRHQKKDQSGSQPSQREIAQAEKLSLADECFKGWVAMGYNPVDFWRSHPEDYWMIIDAKQEARKAQDRSQYAGMTLSEVEDIYREAHGGVE